MTKAPAATATAEKPKRETPKPLPQIPGRAAEAGAPAGGGIGVLPVILVGVIMLTGGFFAASFLANGVATARQRMSDAKAKVSPGVEAVALKEAQDLEKAAREKEASPLGLLTAKGLYEKAAAAYEKLVGGTKEEAEKARKHARDVRDKVDATWRKEPAVLALFQEAESQTDAAEKAFKATPPDYATAITLCRQAEAKYRAAAEEARLAAVLKDVQVADDSVTKARQDAVDAGADTYCEAIFKKAESERKEAREKADPFDQRQHLYAAQRLFETAKLAADQIRELKKR
jgi:hypothetical protein